MPVLASFSYPQGVDFACQRQYIMGFTIGWQPGSFATQFGQETRLTEVVYGGYRLVIKFKDWVWDWDNRGFTLGDLFEDYYAIAPGGTDPINAGTVHVSLAQPDTWRTWCLKIVNPAASDWYLFQRLPPADRPYWFVPVDNLPVTPYWFPPYTPA